MNCKHLLTYIKLEKYLPLMTSKLWVRRSNRLGRTTINLGLEVFPTLYFFKFSRQTKDYTLQNKADSVKID